MEKILFDKIVDSNNPFAQGLIILNEEKGTISFQDEENYAEE